MVQIRELLDVLHHARKCCSTKIQPCSYPNCLKIKKLLCHATKCTVRTTGGCQYCKKAWYVINLHSRNCRESNCGIRRCMWVTFSALSHHPLRLRKEDRKKRFYCFLGISFYSYYLHHNNCSNVRSFIGWFGVDFEGMRSEEACRTTVAELVG